jgi:hypothetical protein
MEKDWFIRKKLEYLDNIINKGVINSVSKVIRLIERDIFFRDSLSHFDRRILLTKWSLLYYSGISSVTYTKISTELKNNYLSYFWLVRQLIGFYQLILIIKIFLLPFVITSWLILLLNILFYITIDKSQQVLDYNSYKHIKWLLVINWNSTQFLSDNECNINRGILSKQKIK